jgi:hypothetical protein
MNARTRSKLDMGDRALNFSRAHPDASPGYAAALTGLEQRLTKAQELARAQQEGINQRRAANARKNALRRQMRGTQLRHLARVAKVATRESPELAGKLGPQITAAGISLVPSGGRQYGCRGADPEGAAGQARSG